MELLLVLCLAVSAIGTDASQRIIGGSNVDIADYPYMLALWTSGSRTCGASLIGSTRAVTAAHCVGNAINAYSILGGAADPYVTDCVTCVIRDLNLIVIHPNYDGNGIGYPNDVAVIGFEPVTYNVNFQPIELSSPPDGDYAGRMCIIIGWDYTSALTTLQGAVVSIMTNTDCGDQVSAGSINDGHICIIDDNFAGTCDGDGGGPLECADKLAGVHSWNHETCITTSPSVYSRVSYFYSWIILQ